jgi:hypothetical protein
VELILVLACQNEQKGHRFGHVSNDGLFLRRFFRRLSISKSGEYWRRVEDWRGHKHTEVIRVVAGGLSWLGPFIGLSSWSDACGAHRGLRFRRGMSNELAEQIMYPEWQSRTFHRHARRLRWRPRDFSNIRGIFNSDCSVDAYISGEFSTRFHLARKARRGQAVDLKDTFLPSICPPATDTYFPRLATNIKKRTARIVCD